MGADPDTQGTSADRKQRPIEDKESYRWLQIQEQGPTGIHTLLIGDREADIYDLFIWPRAPHQHLLVRGAWDRKLENPSEQHLWAVAEAAPVRGTTVVPVPPVPRKPGQPEREATLELRTTVVQVARPGHRRADTPAAPPLTVVLAREIDPPDGLAPIDWLLLTTLSAETVDDAARIVRWYSYRWRIERLHFTLKSGGSQVERLQLETRERLERVITLYTIVAWRILWMTYQVRIDPDQSPTVAFSADEIDALGSWCITRVKNRALLC